MDDGTVTGGRIWHAAPSVEAARRAADFVVLQIYRACKLHHTSGIALAGISVRPLTNDKAISRHPNFEGHFYTRNDYTYKPLEEIFAENPDILFIPVTATPRHSDPSRGFRGRVIQPESCTGRPRASRIHPAEVCSGCPPASEPERSPCLDRSLASSVAVRHFA